MGNIEGPPGLVGHYFHSVVAAADGCEVIDEQGRVLAEVVPHEIYLIETYSWLDGSTNRRRLMRLSRMHSWYFYATFDAMQYEAEHGDAARQASVHRSHRVE